MTDTVSATDFQTTVEVRASPDRVWAVLRDVEHWPQWTPTVTSVQPRDPGPLEVGSQVRLHQPKLAPAEWRVTHLEEGHGFTWVCHHPGVRVTAGHWLEPTPEGSRITLSLHFAGFLGPLVARVYRSLNRRYLAMEADGLRSCCER
jgi:uncharacterized protein YndB with AHSA1/START domain